MVVREAVRASFSPKCTMLRYALIAMCVVHTGKESNWCSQWLRSMSLHFAKAVRGPESMQCVSAKVIFANISQQECEINAENEVFLYCSFSPQNNKTTDIPVQQLFKDRNANDSLV
jgi:hypothetical protein